MSRLLEGRIMVIAPDCHANPDRVFILSSIMFVTGRFVVAAKLECPTLEIAGRTRFCLMKPVSTDIHKIRMVEFYPPTIALTYMRVSHSQFAHNGISATDAAAKLFFAVCYGGL
jgi:hypothetical protein